MLQSAASEALSFQRALVRTSADTLLRNDLKFATWYWRVNVDRGPDLHWFWEPIALRRLAQFILVAHLVRSPQTPGGGGRTRFRS